MNKSVAILGYGSVGKAHAESASSLLFEEIFIIDPFEKPQLQAIEKGYKVFSSIKNFFQEVKTVDHAIIANWGPDHCDSALKFLDNQVKSITVEKPFCTSLRDGLQVIEATKIDGIFSNVHFRWSYLDLPAKINQIALDYDLGEPIEIVCQGGAHCLSTGGTHWIDFARKLFAKRIKTISSNCKSKSINPRSSSLMYLDGYLFCGFEEEKKLILNFSNLSSLPLSVRINFRNAMIEIALPNQILLYTRDQNEVIKYEDRVTRYGPVSFLKAFELGASNTTKLVLEEVLNRPMSAKASANDGFMASAAIIAALESADSFSRELFFEDVIASRSDKNWSFS